MKKNLTDLIIFFIFALLAYNSYIAHRNSNIQAQLYKSIVIENDSLRKIKNGHYQKIVDDRSTEKELIVLLKAQNKVLFDYINKSGKKPISYTRIEGTPVKKSTHVSVIDSSGIKTFEDYYPSKENFFIRYRGKFIRDSLHGDWNFGKLKVGIVVSEKEKGIYEIDTDAPKWLEIENIEVNSLPITKNNKSLGYYVGLRYGKNFATTVNNVGFVTGIKYKRFMGNIEINTNNEVKLGVDFFLN